jgi:hypothetical protein
MKPQLPPPSPPGQPSLAAHALTEKAERDKYLNLGRELAAQVVALRGLWKQRDLLLSDKEKIVWERARVCNALHKAGKDPQKRGLIEKDLEGVNYRQDLKVGEIEGCEAAIGEAEVALHAKYPLASATFTRLYSALVDWTLADDYQALTSLIDPECLGLQPEVPLNLQPIERTVSSAEFAAMSPGAASPGPERF